MNYEFSIKAGLRRKWHIADHEYVILFAGRITPVKGLIFLIEAFRKVLKRIPDCRLLIAGGDEVERYKQGTQNISSNVTFTGLLDKSALYELYQLADAGVIPSLYEPFGYVAVEMMMHGLPVIATATSGLNEVVDDACGLKVPVIARPDKTGIDTDLLAKKIIYLFEHPDEAKEMGLNGRKKYLQAYTSEVFRQNMLTFYKSMMDIE